MSLVTDDLARSEMSDASRLSDSPELKELEQKSDSSSGSQSSVSVPASCHAKTFLEIVYGDFCAVRDAGQECGEGGDDEQEREVTAITRRIVCIEKSIQIHNMQNLRTSSGDLRQHDVPAVHIFNSSQLLSHLGSRSNSSIFGRCTVVLFYAPWCTFCVRLAPQYNALARVFPTLDVVAIDAYQFSR